MSSQKSAAKIQFRIPRTAPLNEHLVLNNALKACNRQYLFNSIQLDMSLFN